MESEPLTTTFTPAVGLTSPANLSGGVVANSAPQPVPVHLNVQGNLNVHQFFSHGILIAVIFDVN